MKLVRLFILAILCACASAQVIAIKAGRLVDPDSGNVLSDQVILIRGNKFEAVGKGLAIPAEAKVSIYPRKPSCRDSSTATRTWQMARAWAQTHLMF